MLNDPQISTVQQATNEALQAVNNSAELLESELEKKRKADRDRFNKLFGMWSNLDTKTSAPKQSPEKLSREARKSSGQGPKLPQARGRDRADEGL